ncbi:MAG: type III-B CRISPR-associated protein Cas10/Cmr2 [Gammaproteobacteria bacterium SHHR-1]
MEKVETLWQTKLAARIHDPAEKALVLLRDPAGHEGGTSAALKRLLGLDRLPEQIDPDNDQVLSRVLFKKGLPLNIYRHVQRADWWAAAADRPQWPMQEITLPSGKTLAVAPWAQVRWAQQPVLIHPLTGEQFPLLGGLQETEIQDIKRRSFEHFSELLLKLGAVNDNPQDWRKILLTYWRFGPDLSVSAADTQDNGQLGSLWAVLPADTRIPDHSIWDHLDLTSAFAGAFAADPKGEAALLTLSIGPVQGFIAAARSTSDLWAGSHLLSRLSWEAMRPLCEQLGPDAILFPRLRGIPQVDLWLREQMQLPDELFADCPWNRGASDANPLFSAALPNRFVALVPASQAQALAEQVTQSVRQWLRDLGRDVVTRLLHEAGLDPESPLPFEQMRQQLEGFPEVHWAAVPFSLIKPRNPDKQTDLDTIALSAAMAPFFDSDAGPYGFLASPAWQILSQQIDWADADGGSTRFFAPNPGVLYPAVFDLAERVMAAAKATRAFQQSEQSGWRCSLSGEAEWLTTDRSQLQSSYRQQTDTLWARIAVSKPSWAKKGEHLSALPAIKRLWPSIFQEEVGKALGAGEQGEQKTIGRFVVSTHTMALAHQLDQWLSKGGTTAPGFAALAKDAEAVALPRKLTRKHAKNPALADAKRLPSLLEMAAEADGDEALFKAKRLVQDSLATALDRDEIRLETYYGLIMLDGDRMGEILSGEDPADAAQDTRISYRDSFHPRVQKGFDAAAAKQALIQRYAKQKRSLSPNRHLAISSALNEFSQTVVRHVVEEEYLGRVIYAGGDDVLAMLPVSDLLPAMQRLRHAYSGTTPEDECLDWGQLQGRNRLVCKGGFAWLNGRLMRMMGRQASASCGAIIAHHQAPLAAVMRELRSAEQRAKNEGGRNAFSISLIKRSGGALRLTEHWGEPLVLLAELRDYLASPDTSRRAVYHSQQWLKDLPEPSDFHSKEQPEMLERLLAYQLERQSAGHAQAQAAGLAKRLANLAAAQSSDGRKWLENFMSVAEFLARETRSGGAA